MLVLPTDISRWLATELMESEEAEQVTRAQVLRHLQADMKQSHARLDLMYDDRLAGRIDAATYDRKAKEIRQEVLRIQTMLGNAAATTVAPTGSAVDLMRRTSEIGQEFQSHSGVEQRKFLQMVLEGCPGKRASCGCPCESYSRNCDFRTR
jgi:hypothetical protein